MTKGNATSATAPKMNEKKFLNLTQEEKISYYILAGTILLVAFIRSKFTAIPFERDEGAYSYYGKLLLEGGVPYKDFYEQKFPGIFYLYAMIVGIFGDTVKGMHWGFTFLNLGTILFLFFAVKRMFSPLAAAVTALTYGIVSLTPYLSGFTVQSEHGVAFFISLGILFYAIIQKNKGWQYFLYMGLAMGLAFMVKTTGVFLVLWGGIVIITDFIYEKQNRTIKEFFRRTLIYSAGVFLMFGLFFLLVIAKGAYTEMIYWTIEVPKEYVGTIKWEDGKQYLKYTFEAITKDYKFFWVHAGCALLILLLNDVSWKTKFMVLTLIFFSGATIFPGYYFYGHYWIQLVPGLAVLSGITFYSLNNLIKTRFGIKSPRVQYIYAAVFIFFAGMHLNKQRDYYFNPNYDRILRTVYGANPFPEAARIADYINANSNPEDAIVSIGSEPQLYFYTKKNCPSRHAYFTSLVFGSKYHAQWQREFVADVEKAKPRYVVFFNHGISLMIQPTADRYILDWFNKYVTDNYNVIGCVDMIDGYISANYAWKEQLAGFKPQGQNVIYIYERKPEAAPQPQG